MSVVIGDIAPDMALMDFTNGQPKSFKESDYPNTVILLSFIEIKSASDVYFQKLLEDRVTDPGIRKFAVFYSGNDGGENFPPVPPPAPSAFNPSIMQSWIQAKQSYYNLNPTGNSQWLYLDSPFANSDLATYLLDFNQRTPALFVLNTGHKVVDAFCSASTDNGNAKTPTGTNWSSNDLINLDWATIPNPANPGAPWPPADPNMPLVDKITSYAVQRIQDLLNANPVVQVGNANGTWVTDSSVLTFAFRGKVSPNYYSKKARGACDPNNYLLDANPGLFQSVAPAQVLNVSQYLSNAVGEARSAMLQSNITATLTGQKPTLSLTAQLVDLNGVPFQLEPAGPQYEVLSSGPVAYLRDNLEVDFGYPHNGALACSPDIVLKQVAVANPQADLGDTNQNVYALSDNAEYGQRNYVYVRAYNRGATAVPAGTVTGTAYWADGSTILLPNSWNLIGSSIFNTAIDLARGRLVVAPVINFDNVPVPGHYCFLATLVSGSETPDQYRNTLASQITSVSDYYQVIRSEYRTTWRNFNVVDLIQPPPPPPAPPPPSPGPKFRPLWFFFPGLPGKKPGRFQLQIIARLTHVVPKPGQKPLPTGMAVHVDLPDEMLRAMPGWEKQEPQHEKLAGYARFPMKLNEAKLFPAATLTAKHKPRIWIHVPIPETPYLRNSSLVVRHLWEGKEIGRMTWIFRPIKPVPKR